MKFVDLTNPDRSHTIEVASIYGKQSQQGLVELTIDGVKLQMTKEKAREVRGMLDGAIEAAVSDELMMRFLMQKIGLPEESAVAALRDFREMRQGFPEPVFFRH